MMQPPLTEAYPSPDGKTAEPGGRKSFGARLSVFSRPTLSSLASVSVWQLGNYLLPLTFIPYLTRTLGVHSFGLTALATAVIAYPLLVTDWGFVLLATHRVSIARHDKDKVNEIIWSVVCAKVILASLSCLALAFGVALFVQDALTRSVLFAAMVNVVAAVFSLDWVLRGMERFARFAAGSLVGRLLAVPVIFAVVRSPADAANAVLALALGAILVAALSIAMCVRLGVLRGTPTSAVQIAKFAVEQLRSGVWVFLSSLASSVYTHGLLITLGLVRGAYSVGIYSSAEKIRNPVSNMLSPLLMVFFPRISALVRSDPQQARKRALQLVAVQGAATLVLSIVLSAVAPLAVRLIAGPDFSAATPVLRLIALCS
jgi:O-antigen/teichoic acid export membrane protein